MKRSLMRMLVALAAVALFATACGSDALDAAGDAADAAGDAVEAAGDAVEETADAAADTAGDAAEAVEDAVTDDEPEEDAPEEEPEEEAMAELSGDPVVIGLVGGSVGEETWFSVTEGAAAAVASINADGGIDGRPMELLSCRDEADPNITIECMQSLIDQGASVFTGNFNCCGAAVNPEIAASGRSAIGFMLTGGDFASANYYSTDGGAFVAGAGQYPACAALGAKRIATGYVDNEAGQQLIPLLQGAIAPGWPETENVLNEPLAVGLADYAPSAAKIIASDADCVVILHGLEGVLPLVQALRAQGYEGRITASGAVTTGASLVAELGEDANGAVVPHLYDHTSAGWAAYVADLAANGDRVPDDLGVMSWLAVQIAADVISQVGDDPEAITAGIPEIVVDYDTMGLTETNLDWSVPGPDPLGAGLVNIRDWGSIPAEIVDGEEVISDAGFVGLLTGAGG